MAKEGGQIMNIKVVPMRIEVNAKNPEEPLKVEYMVELTTEKYSDFVGSGITYLSDPSVVAVVDSLVQTVITKISEDLGLQETETEEKHYDNEEDL